MARRHPPSIDEEEQLGQDHDPRLPGWADSNERIAPKHAKRSNATGLYWRRLAFALALPCLGLYYLATHSPHVITWPHVAPTSFDTVRSPGLASMNLKKTCPDLRPIGLDEFDRRRERLATLLSMSHSSADGSGAPWAAYVLEPGPNSMYYVNLSQSDWYLSERPWLLALSPARATTKREGGSSWHLSVLTPTFELSRSQRLPFAVKHLFASESVSWVTWDEADDPYKILVRHLDELRQEAAAHVGGAENRQQPNATPRTSEWKIHLEENVRQFVASGLTNAAASIHGSSIQVALADLEIRQQRMRKTTVELSIQRCAAKITIEALRAVRKELRLGMTELEGEKLITEALEAGGLTDIEAITLFGPNAALPHAKAGSKRLEDGEFALFDVTGNLYGYMSDMTRTMLPDIHPRGRFMKGARDDSPPIRTWPSPRSQKIWETVHRAQEAALEALKRPSVHAADVDRAARKVIAREGWEKYFTHRLGHGIGLQVHEAPYLNGGNVAERLRAGETFSNEPGVYIEGSANEATAREGGIGVRLEDMVHKTEDGWELLSGEPLARSPWDP